MAIHRKFYPFNDYICLMTPIIRKSKPQDVQPLWILMHDLAVFEKYIDSFKITPEIVLEKGFKKSPPDFYSFVAEIEDGKLAGMIVYYFLPYTAVNKPAIYIKELYVNEGFRGMNIGEMLMRAVAEEARKNNCCTIKWTVAPWNNDGMRFYERLGANQNNEWINYELSEEAFSKLL